MKKILSLLFLFLLSFHNVKSQCTPDPTCTDVGNSGEMCP